MKGKKISSYEFNLENLLRDLSLAADAYKNNNIERIVYKSDEFFIDTCLPTDTGYWETGISSKNFNDGRWIIVDEYESKKKAESGHKKWIEFMTTSPKKLTDIHINEIYKFTKS